MSGSLGGKLFTPLPILQQTKAGLPIVYKEQPGDLFQTLGFPSQLPSVVWLCLCNNYMKRIEEYNSYDWYIFTTPGHLQMYRSALVVIKR